MMYDYWYWQDVFSKEELVDLHKIIQNNKIDAENTSAENSLKKTKLTVCPWFNLKQKLFNIEQLVLKSNQENFGYNLWPQNDNDGVGINEYDSKNLGEYDWHFDGSSSAIYDIKLTVLINASIEPYEGGEFSLFLNGGSKHIKELDKPGNIFMFKSHLYHKVNSVIKGKRHSIVLFYKGPKFI